MPGRMKNILLLVCAVQSMLFCNGCDRYARYRFLSYFFDGVPHPDAPLLEQQAARETGRLVEKNDKTGALVRLFRHPASGESNACEICHGSEKVPGSMLTPPRDICKTCHVHVKKNLLFIHGPTALDCMACHDVHESKSRYLVKELGNELCLICHYQENKKRMRVSEGHKDVAEDEFVCLSCHDPHGGQDRFFLKEKPDAAKVSMESTFRLLSGAGSDNGSLPEERDGQRGFDNTTTETDSEGIADDQTDQPPRDVRSRPIREDRILESEIMGD